YRIILLPVVRKLVVNKTLPDVANLSHVLETELEWEKENGRERVKEKGKWRNMTKVILIIQFALYVNVIMQRLRNFNVYFVIIAYLQRHATPSQILFYKEDG
ncbi:hypothetical protein CHS0354_021925, partial [Potamilus streckersoni]